MFWLCFIMILKLWVLMMLMWRTQTQLDYGSDSFFWCHFSFSVCVGLWLEIGWWKRWMNHKPIACLRSHSHQLSTAIRSQSLDRINIMVNKVPCVTPTCKLWLRKRRRMVSGDELLALQGLNMRAFSMVLSETEESLKCKLAGNAFSFHNFVIGFTAAISTLAMTWLGWSASSTPDFISLPLSNQPR